ncbi:TPA: hypothetical protein ACKP3Z_005524 [Pseudomonas aeruginosa]|jgi:hypothetical protein|uniref:Uncharacterized protein n=1 Tax=Pseudomonas helleri TaxID=1608996 RepID=A0A7X1YCX7_9PSED|nr:MULTISPECIES: hypothetical protein [Pseudomonas]KSO60569.1 hypothetical protein APA99_28195 [Pseudomonas aeruginosa]MBH9345108.1 hypothetical protein [Pseudomonas aeruginosa]MBH9399079.1 hypothetical protein [Pseudomonas aeruginosa]MBI7349457.1 hypothetical protein [Pseudomonas aeruginosa]MBI7373830.1 hypothetical protein [Pseudomonas aeruginosa]
MTEATNIWTATASEITKAVRESLIAMNCGEPGPGDVYDQLMLLGRSGLEELVPSVREIGAREFDSVMAVVVDLLGGDGIAVHGELPIWLRVYPNVEGRLPAYSADDWRWIRLSTIQEVQPRRAIAIGDDSRTWQFMVNVVANGQVYSATQRLFLGASVEKPVDRLLTLVSAAVSEEQRRRMQL